MPRSRFLEYVPPLATVLAGLALSVWRFQEHDPYAGLAFCLGGVLLSVVVIFRMPGAR